MIEITRARQIPGESKRRWFSSEEFDLIVWIAADGTPSGFELCYDKARQEKSIRWTSDGGFHHMAIDDGEQRPGKYKSSPVLTADGAFDAHRVHGRLTTLRHYLPAEVAGFVFDALESHPAFGVAA